MNIAFALSATVFFSILSWLLFNNGSHTVQVLTLIALFLGAASQFVAQDDARTVQQIALIISYLAMVLAIIAIATFAVT